MIPLIPPRGDHSGRAEKLLAIQTKSEATCSTKDSEVTRYPQGPFPFEAPLPPPTSSEAPSQGVGNDIARNPVNCKHAPPWHPPVLPPLPPVARPYDSMHACIRQWERAKVLHAPMV